ncbi:cytidine and dCMP deaminase domain-containing protein 1-like [Stylophora pistillata]|uniref:cytidine and dCMP deaminase domain-containing protein 1-like n=1 Tax=Stylophora pistillata TaxID=50429 RepID=UPI000C03A841|nr:cytidine and dCMP deaminase domain-containing protein 1-like [Stylophora pistillata]
MDSKAVDASASHSSAGYTKRESRISKEDLCMVIALWMERFPLATANASFNKVGAVLMLPNDMIHAVDCSRDRVHGVARLVIKHQDVAKDCKVFVSRKPCSFCTKLLVQSQVKRVFYLPIEPECSTRSSEFRDEISRVDNLFKTSAIGQSVFVPTVGTDVFADAERKNKTPQKAREKKRDQLFKDYCNAEWMTKVKDHLPWPAFDDNMKEQVCEDFKKTLEWMARLLVDREKGYNFEPLSPVKGTVTSSDPSRNVEKKSENPEVDVSLMTLAKFLAERSDDPKTGVGAVIVNIKNEIIALGWNGFPTKALYGEFPRASHSDQPEDKKYPYMIHAEQNALLLRNTNNLTNGTLFVTKTPCDECTPLLAMEGIKTVFLGEKYQPPAEARNLSYKEFGEKVEGRVFECFQMLPTASTTAYEAKRNLQEDFKEIPPKRQKAFSKDSKH